jgi:hypothetical protein
MVPGLKKLLELIKATPGDQRLIDRFVSLSLELTSDERVDAMIELAQILATKVPVKAIDIAWGLFKQDRMQPESLKIVATALEALGKNGRAVAVREDLKRLTTHPAGTHEHENARLSIQNAIAATLRGGEEAESPETVQTKTSQKPVSDADLDVRNDDIVPPPSFSLESTGVNADVEKSAGASSNLIPELDLGLPQDKTIDRPVVVEKKDSVDSRSIAALARASAAAPGAGIPEAIPKKEQSSHSKAFNDRLERDSAHQVTRSSSAEPPRGVGMPRPNDPAACRVFVKELIGESRWSDLLLFLDDAFADGSNPLLLELFEVHKLQKIDLQFSGRWIDALVRNRQERRALRFIHQVLIEEPHLAWAKMVQTKLDLITERLRLQKIVWREADGVSALRLQIEQLRPKLGVYVANPPIAS